MGKVTGVNYRATTKAVADQLGVKGSVRNAGHEVEIYACGNDLQIEQFLEWCSEGPDHGSVEHVQKHILDETEVKAGRRINFDILK